MTNQAILSAIENELVRVEGYIANLRQKVHAALQQTTETTLGTTPPPLGMPTLPVHLTTGGAFHPRGFWYRGTFQRCDTYIDIYTGLLRAIALANPDALPRTADTLRRFGRTRTYLATDRAQLFQDQTPEWARSHSLSIADGWFADTNLGLVTMKKLMRRILRANGLREGTDTVIVWDRTPVNPASPPQLLNHATPARH